MSAATSEESNGHKKKKKKRSRDRSHSKVKSQSRASTDAGYYDKNKKDKKDKKKHGRYATAQTGYNNKNKTKTKTKTNQTPKRPKRTNKIKAARKKNGTHNKAATTQNVLSSKKKNSTSHRSYATTQNALSPNTASSRKRSASKPRSFRHKFNMTEMQLVIGQISEMKNSWKTPTENIMKHIYEIINMEERPHLNGKHCRVMLILDDENYRVSLTKNSSEHIVCKSNIKIAFETENLYILWESQQKTKKKSSAWGGSNDNTLNVPNEPHGRPPNIDPDDMYTIQAFESSFNKTYEFRRCDFYCMAFCIILGFILSACGIFLYINNDETKDMHSIGAFTAIFAPILGILSGLYIGCLWYCIAVGKGRMDYYLGTNRFCGFQCAMCDFCKYQYFIVVSLCGIFIIIVSTLMFFLFDQFIETNNNINEDSDPINIEEQNVFKAIEIIAIISGVGLFMSGIIVYYCCSNRKIKPMKNPSIHDDNFQL